MFRWAQWTGSHEISANFRWPQWKDVQKGDAIFSLDHSVSLGFPQNRFWWSFSVVTSGRSQYTKKSLSVVALAPLLETAPFGCANVCPPFDLVLETAVLFAFIFVHLFTCCSKPPSALILVHLLTCCSEQALFVVFLSRVRCAIVTVVLGVQF